MTPPKAPIKLVLDSGAFSAWSRKSTVDLDAYIAYIKTCEGQLDHYINLDVIPGEFGRIPSPQEVESSARQGWGNLLKMESAGLKPMPVFHQGERFYWLEKLIDHGCDYVGISPANDRTTSQKRLWLDRVFDLICDKEGWPAIKTHAFGATAVALLFRYPWFSADSTTWLLLSAYGHIYVPDFRGGEFRYDCTPNLVTVSNRSPARLDLEGKHYDALPLVAQRKVAEYIESMGVTLQEVQTSGYKRMRVNIQFFQRVEEKKSLTPFRRTQIPLFA